MKSGNIPFPLPTQFQNRLENPRKTHKFIRNSRNDSCPRLNLSGIAEFTLPNILKIDFLHMEILTAQRFERVVSKLCPKLRAFGGGPDVGGIEAKDSIPHI